MDSLPFEQLARVERFRFDLHNYWPLLFDRRFEKIDEVRNEDAPRALLEELETLVTDTGVDLGEVAQLASEFIEGLRVSTQVNDTALAHALDRAVEEKRKVVSAIPKGIEKARLALKGLIDAEDWKHLGYQVLDAMVLLHDEVPHDLVNAVVDDWIKRRAPETRDQDQDPC